MKTSAVALYDLAVTAHAAKAKEIQDGSRQALAKHAKEKWALAEGSLLLGNKAWNKLSKKQQRDRIRLATQAIRNFEADETMLELPAWAAWDPDEDQPVIIEPDPAAVAELNAPPKKRPRKQEDVDDDDDADEDADEEEELSFSQQLLKTAQKMLAATPATAAAAAPAATAAAAPAAATTCKLCDCMITRQQLMDHPAFCTVDKDGKPTCGDCGHRLGLHP